MEMRAGKLSRSSFMDMFPDWGNLIILCTWKPMKGFLPNLKKDLKEFFRRSSYNSDRGKKLYMEKWTMSYKEKVSMSYSN